MVPSSSKSLYGGAVARGTHIACLAGIYLVAMPKAIGMCRT